MASPIRVTILGPRGVGKSDYVRRLLGRAPLGYYAPTGDDDDTAFVSLRTSAGDFTFEVRTTADPARVEAERFPHVVVVMFEAQSEESYRVALAMSADVARPKVYCGMYENHFAELPHVTAVPAVYVDRVVGNFSLYTDAVLAALRLHRQDASIMWSPFRA